MLRSLISAESWTPPLRYSLTLQVLQFLGLLAAVRFTNELRWSVLIVVLLVQPLVISVKWRRLWVLPETLVPLGIACVVMALRLLVDRAAHGDGISSAQLLSLEPWGEPLRMATILSVMWALLAQMGSAFERVGRWLCLQSVFGYVFLVLTLAWSAITYFAIRTAGATGSDPYAYVQMAVDIAQHGTPLHSFKLAPLVVKLGLPTWPAVPIGYLPFLAENGISATVWPPGYSAFLAAAYKLAGESAMYTTTPLLGLATLIATWYLCLEILRMWPAPQRRLAAGLTVLILATSYEQINRLVVPLADIPAQLFSVLTIYFALRAAREQRLVFGTLSGLCLGLAFAVRYSQVLLCLGVLLAFAPLLFKQRSRRFHTFSLVLISFAIAACIVALPILSYHALAFGSPLSVGSQELQFFSWRYIPRNLALVAGDLAAVNEFLYVSPFLVWGVVALWPRLPWIAGVLLMWVLSILLFHLPYQGLRIRDLLSLFPVFALWTGVGMASTIGLIEQIGRPILRASLKPLAYGLIITVLFVRTNETWRLIAVGDEFGKLYYSFGYLRVEQRAAFTNLTSLTTPEAVVASSLNSGAIELYTGRSTVRPAYWTAAEWMYFVTSALEDGRKVYLLVDGDEMGQPLEEVRLRYKLNLITLLNVPYFHPDGSAIDSNVPLYEVAYEVAK